MEVTIETIGMMTTVAARVGKIAVLEQMLKDFAHDPAMITYIFTKLAEIQKENK